MIPGLKEKRIYYAYFIYYIKTNKGNALVVLDKEDYEEWMKDMEENGQY